MRKKAIYGISLILILVLCSFLFFNSHKKENKQENNIKIFSMSNYEAERLPTTKIEEKNTSDEQNIEKQVVEENESIEEQGNIEYNGAEQTPNILLGAYSGLTYYSQIDRRWSNHLFTSNNNYTQTIGISGCGPTSATIS